MFFVVRFTRDLKHKYGYPEIVPGGMPVDIDAAARAQHEAAMGSIEPQQPSLVQIQPGQPAAPGVTEPPGPEPTASAEPAVAEASAPNFTSAPPPDTEPEAPPSQGDLKDPEK
jgi:hypothetical protein